MIEDSRANLIGRSEFIVSHDINSTSEQMQILYDNEALRCREAVVLDDLWQGSTFPNLIDNTAEKFGHTYTLSTEIGPKTWVGTHLPALPLRLGSRVRDVFMTGEEGGLVQAVRGQLLMHRSLNGKAIEESGFYILLSKLQGQDLPILTYGRTDTEKSNWKQVILEVFLGAKTRVWDKIEPIEVNEQRTKFESFDPILSHDGLEKNAKEIASIRKTQWQQEYLNLANIKLKSGADKPTTISLDSLFQLQNVHKRFRRDKLAIGVLRQNSQTFFNPHDLVHITDLMQKFFDSVHTPIQTRHDQAASAIVDLENGTQLSKLDSMQITELDIARSIIHNWKRPGDAVTANILPLQMEEVPYYLKHGISPTYDKYPELKDHIDKHFTLRRLEQAKVLEKRYPGLLQAVNSLDEKVLNEFIENHPKLKFSSVDNSFGPNPYHVYKADNEGESLGLGLPWGEYDKLMEELCEINPAPSKLAFPYD